MVIAGLGAGLLAHRDGTAQRRSGCWRSVFPTGLLPLHLEPEHHLRALPAARSCRSCRSSLAAAVVVAAVRWMRRARSQGSVRNGRDVALTLLSIAPPAYTAIGYDAERGEGRGHAAGVLTGSGVSCRPGTSIRLEGRSRSKLPAAYKTSYVKQLRLDGAGDYADDRHPVSRRLLAVLRPVTSRIRAASRAEYRRLPANLRRRPKRWRASPRNDRSSRPGAAHPQGEAA